MDFIQDFPTSMIRSKSINFLMVIVESWQVLIKYFIEQFAKKMIEAEHVDQLVVIVVVTKWIQFQGLKECLLTPTRRTESLEG